MSSADSAQAQPAAAPGALPPSGQRLPRILLVDDDLINQKVMVNLLRRKGWEAVAVASGPKCLDLLARERFDLILMDIQMPEMDGFQTTARIRQQEAGPTPTACPAAPRVPIVALTTVSQPGTREKCFSSGMDDHLTKPVNTGTLYATIARLLRLPEG